MQKYKRLCLHDPIQVVFRINYLKRGIRVSFLPGYRWFHFFTGFPFYFIGVQGAVTVFDPINLLLVIGAPKVVVTQHSGVSLVFSARSEERRVGKECVSTGKYRWAAYN